MAVLSNFTRITQAGSNVSGKLTGLIDERKRKKKTTAAQENAAHALHEAAPDIHAFVVTRTSDKCELPTRFNFADELGRSLNSTAWRAGLNEK